jgi:23S rRNA pseudouridine955/2504/2580 synthase
MKEIIVDKAQANQRLDKYLKRVFREAGSGFLYKMLRKKNIVLNDKKASGSEILGEGDVIKVFFSDETFDKMRGAGKR